MTGLPVIGPWPEKPKGHHPVSDDGPLSEFVYVWVSAASSEPGSRPKKVDANNGDEDDAQHTHDW
jgi:hypothetical protein